MAGVKGKKGKKMMAKASKVATSRTVKGKNKVEKIPRQDRKKGAASRSGRPTKTRATLAD